MHSLPFLPNQEFTMHKRDLEENLGEFQDYYNTHGVHQTLNLKTPNEAAGKDSPPPANLRNYAWKSYCRGLFQTPKAA